MKSWILEKFTPAAQVKLIKNVKNKQRVSIKKTNNFWKQDDF